MARRNDLNIVAGISVDSKQAQKEFKSFERTMNSIPGEKTVFIKAKFEGAEGIQKRLTNAISGVKGIKFENKGVLQEVLGIKDAEKALAQFNAKLPSLVGRAQIAMSNNIRRVSEYIAAHNAAIDFRKGQIFGGRGVASAQQLDNYYSTKRGNRLERLETSIADAVANNNLEEEIRRRKERAKLWSSDEKMGKKEVSQRLSNELKYIDTLEKRKKAIDENNKALTRQGQLFGSLSSLVTRYFSLYTVADFAKKIAETTGYFQQQQVALEGILGSASKAQTVLNDIKGFALQSPFQTKELVTFTKQLAAFGVGNNDLFPTVKKLADISAGLGVDMNRIILAYGQVKSAAVLRGQELRQFTEAGIPMVKALSDKFTELNGKLVTTADVFKLISERKVSFEMVASVLSDMTNEGGKFYKMQENITETLYGQMQKLKDVWTLSLDKLGRDSGSFIMKIVKGLQEIVKNAKQLASVLAYTALGRGIGRLAEGVIGLATRFRRLGMAALFSKGMLTGAIGIAGAAIGAIVGAYKAHKDKQNELKRRMTEVADSYAKDTAKMVMGIDSLVKKINSANVGTKIYNDAVSALASNYSQFISTGMIEALRGQRDAASDAAAEFLRLSESIKETIRQSKLYESIEAQAKTAANKAAQDTGEDMESTPWYRPEKGNLLQTTRIKGYVQGSPMYERNYLGGVENFANQHGISAESLVSPISKIIQDALVESAEEGFDNNTKKGMHKIKALFAKRIGDAYKFDAETIEAIVNNAIDFANWTDYEEAIKKFAAAAATTFGKIKKPFDAFDKKISSGRFAESADADKIEKEVNKEAEVLAALRKAMSAAKIGTYAGSDLEKLINGANPQDLEFAYKIVQGIDKFREGKTEEEKTLLYQISQMFSERVGVRSDRAARVTAAFRNSNSQVYKWRNDDDLKNIVATYGAPTNETVEELRERLGTDKAALKSKKERSRDVQEQALLQKQIEALTVLQGASLYAMGDKPIKGGAGAGGGWRRMFADLFSYIKEARAEEKKLVEHSAGLTSALADQINSGQLEDTAVKAFWSEGSPFKKFIDKMDKYGLETKVFSKDFLKGALSDIATKQIEATGTINFEDVWDQLIAVIKGRSNELSKDPNMKSTVDAIESYLQQMVMEGEKFFGRDKVEKLIDEQLKEMRKIGSSIDMIKSRRSMFDRISNSSNYLAAQQAVYGGGSSYEPYYASQTSRRHLNSLLNAGVGQGISNTDAGISLRHLLNGGNLGISNLNELIRIKDELIKEAAKTTIDDMSGDTPEARQANFEQFKGVMGQFDNLIKQLMEDIISDFEKLMALRGPIMKATHEIVDAYHAYIDAYDRINKAENLTDKQQNEMRIKATQDLYTSVAKGLGGKGMPDYVNRLFGASGNNTGVTDAGFKLGMWLGGGTLSERAANYAASTVDRSAIEAQFDRTQYESVQAYNDAVNAKFQEEVEKAAEGLQKFTAKMELAGAIIQKLDSYTQKAARFANDLLDAIEANNGLVKDEATGEYKYENDYSTARDAINMIAEFSSGISGAFQSFLSGDIFGGIMGLGGAIAKLFEGIFGIGDSQIQKQQDKLILSNQALERSLTTLNHTLQGEAGIDRWRNMTEQIALLKEEQANSEQLESLEADKKHGDEDKIYTYRNDAEEAARQIEDIIRGIQEEIFGTADELAAKLTDPLVDAFRNGQNAARAWRDSVRSYIGDVLKEVLMTKVVAPKLDKILDEFLGGETDPDKILEKFSDPEKAVGLRNDFFATGEWLEDWFNGFPKAIQEMIAWNSSSSELSGGIQGITEDTARTLEGLSNSILAQHLITNRYLGDLMLSGFAQVQVSWFNDLLNQQKAIRQAAESINGILTGSRDGTRSLQVRIE